VARKRKKKMDIKLWIATIKVGQSFTNGKMTLVITYLDDSGVMFNNGYCPNYHELFLQWTKVS
jgi:hypothetical protein